MPTRFLILIYVMCVLNRIKYIFLNLTHYFTLKCNTIESCLFFLFQSPVRGRKSTSAKGPQFSLLKHLFPSRKKGRKKVLAKIKPQNFLKHSWTKSLFFFTLFSPQLPLATQSFMADTNWISKVTYKWRKKEKQNFLEKSSASLKKSQIWCLCPEERHFIHWLYQLQFVIFILRNQKLIKINIWKQLVISIHKRTEQSSKIELATHNTAVLTTLYPWPSYWVVGRRWLLLW